MMKYPSFLKDGQVIGVCAPSDGIKELMRIKRLDYAIDNFKKRGFIIKETSSVRKSKNGVSNTAKKRAQELESLYLDPLVKAIIGVAGGEFLLEILPYVNFEIIKDNLKWIQGYSDMTGLLFVITTNLDIATIYSNNFISFSMIPWHRSLEENLEILKGECLKQHSYKKYERRGYPYLKGDEGYKLYYNVKWEVIKAKEAKFKGRFIGGCIDILTDILGTQFDKTQEFIEKYQEEGIVWYFDNCEQSYEDLMRIFWKFKYSGWFKGVKGIIIGRSASFKSSLGFSFKEAILRSLGDLEVPIIIGADIGHLAPRMTIINGAIGYVSCKDGQGDFTFWLDYKN